MTYTAEARIYHPNWKKWKKYKYKEIKETREAVFSMAHNITCIPRTAISEQDHEPVNFPVTRNDTG